MRCDRSPAGRRSAAPCRDALRRFARLVSISISIVCAAIATDVEAAPPTVTAGAPPSPAAASPRALAQIEAILGEKAGRSTAQRKLASGLIYAHRMRRGIPIAPGTTSLETGIEIDATGRVLVDVRADVTDALLARVVELGGAVLSSHPRFSAFRARLPLAAVEALALENGVRRIRAADQAMTQALNVSQGDGAHRANLARSTHALGGGGVTVGVISDGAASIGSLVASGDLPAGVTVLPGQAGAGDEGSAMLEIVHDLAPQASLLFATALGGKAQFAANILALRAAGADVIVDDVIYFGEAVFQDDEVAHAVDLVRADGALYFASAGNSGNLNDATAGVWEGDFVQGPPVSGGGRAHDFGSGDTTNAVTVDSPFAFTLQWSDPQGASGNDYDLFLLDASGSSVVAASTNVQNGAGDPFEGVSSSGDDAGHQLLVVRHNGSATRHLHLNAHRGRLEHATVGQTWSHGAARGALSVAAVDAHLKSAGFVGNEPVETYSSDGPRRVFFEWNGAAITPGNLLATGGELRAKPDLAAADCVSTATPGFGFFCGTSAAAPHAAAIAALLIERAGGPGVADPNAVRAALLASAQDIEAPGLDRDSGAGILQAAAAAEIVPPPPCTTNAACDDGIFCNGAETCAAGVCVAGSAPDCPIATPYCEESLDACVACRSPAHCSDGLVCNGSEGCVLGACVGGTPLTCAGGTPYCDEVVAACVACLTSAQCDDGLFCNGSESCSSGICTAGSAPVCSAPTALCSDATSSCVQCLTNGECGTGQCAGGVCVEATPVSALGLAGRAVLMVMLGLLVGMAQRLR